MTQTLSEKDIRDKVKDLRKFYLQLTLYGFINFVCVVIWAVSGGNYFWPIWVMVGWGTALGVQAIWLELFPNLSDILPFMRPEWEEMQVKKIVTQLKANKPQQIAAEAPGKTPLPRIPRKKSKT